MTNDKIVARVVGPSAPLTLKEFLLHSFSGIPGNKANGFLKRGQVSVNGAVATHFNTPLQEGDTVEVNFSRPFVQFKHPRVQLVYEDEDMIVINKGYGLLSVSRGSDKKELTAYDVVKRYLKELSPSNKVFIIHRLDKDTSGLMMFAKSPEAKEEMQHNWNNMVLDRRYVAVVEGSVDSDSGEIKSYLGETSQHEVYSSQNPEDGKPAITRYKVLARGNGFTLMEFSLDTGRKNQIRVHAAKELRHPVVGDRRYGASMSPIGRLALHARTLNFVHPRTRKLMKFQTPVPEKFQKLIKTR